MSTTMDLFSEPRKLVEPVKLRPYQVAAMDSFDASIEKGFRAPILTLATGLGKTILFAKIAEKRVRRGGRVLVTAHREELINQARDKIEAVTGICAGVEKGASRARSSDRIVIGSIQTLAGRTPVGDPFDLLICDECHHSAAESYTNVFKRINPRHMIGVTATPYRGDKRALSTIYDDAPFSMSLLDGVKQGYLCEPVIETLPIKIDMSKVRVKGGDFSESDLDAALRPMLETLADLIAAKYAHRKIVTFMPLCETSRIWVDLLNSRGIPAMHVEGSSPNRREILAAYTENKFRHISNAMLLTEGWDEPGVDGILNLRLTRSRGLLAQIVGRGTRLHPGKKECLILDPLFQHERHNIIAVGDLAGVDDAQGKRISDIMRERGLGLGEAADAEENERRNKLAEELARASKRTPYQKKIGELALALDYAELDTWEPTTHWHEQPPTAKQLAMLANAGVDTSIVTCSGIASEIIGRIVARRETGMATVKQVRYARRLGHKSPETMTFAEATAWINENSGRRAA